MGGRCNGFPEAVCVHVRHVDMTSTRLIDFQSATDATVFMNAGCKREGKGGVCVCELEVGVGKRLLNCANV
jgi:hypothetical protein